MQLRLHVPRSRGFTLIELVMSIVVVGVLASMGATMLGSGFRSFFLSREITQNDWQGRLALERMTRDLRAVRTPTDLTTMTAGQIAFTDSDNDQINYTLNGTTLTRAQNGGTAWVLADNVTAVTGLAFSYLKNDGLTTAAAATDVYYITVQLTISSANASTTYRSTVKPTSF
jgi:prepilin-type N-terminal cleavage/methylation domain-containing protein